MEMLVGFTAWNYSKYFLNINGRVCLQYSIYWGILGLLWIKWCYPYIDKYIDKMNYNLGKNLMTILIIFLIFNSILTMNAINRAKEKELGVLPTNNYERFLDNTFNRDYLKNMFNNRWISKKKPSD